MAGVQDGRARKMRRCAEQAPGLRSLHRPVVPPEADSPQFPLHYLRVSDGASAPIPVVVIPGGPGLASAAPYRKFRDRAVAHGLDVLMMEHRGVGLSRRDTTGHDLPREAMRIEYVVDDLAAVLIAERIGKAVIVGSSYGSYVAQAFAATHPDRVAGLLLDSPMLSARSEHHARDYVRDLLWRGTTGRPETKQLAAKMRDLLDREQLDELTLGNAARIVYEFTGADGLERLLDLIADGRAATTLALLGKAAPIEIEKPVPYHLEFDLVAEIAFGELGYAANGDGRIFDGSQMFDRVRQNYSAFDGEPYQLDAALPTFDFPVTVLSGDRDLRTPRPVAESIVRLAPAGQLIPLADQGHSALDTHVKPLLAAARELAHGRATRAFAAALSAATSRRAGGPSRHLGTLISWCLRLDRVRAALHRRG